ncbi:MAG TPA: glycosyltransferase family 4 protein [Holophagaceae bacterium]|nr:glycosyltransferase family 4 protein [Holophagaceae bacterium]
MRVCFFIWGLRAAGAERVLTFLANRWAAKGWDVTILTMEDGSLPPFYPLAPGIRIRPLGLMREGGTTWSGLANNLGRLRVLRRAVREARPDVLVSFIDKANTLAVLATRGLGIPVVVSERTDPSRRSLGRAWERLRAFAYRRADALVFQSSAVRDWFPAPISRKGLVIPNPVPPPPPGEAPSREGPRRMVALGRLYPVKGFDVLLEAFAAASARVPGWELEIWGEGPERAALERQVEALGLAARVRLPGLTEQPFDVLRASDLFVLPSRAEGFPNALVEAMACGKPVLCTDFGGAAREIVRDGVDGRVVPPADPAALAEALAELMADSEARDRLAARAPEVMARFEPEQVLAQWEAALLSTLPATLAGTLPSSGGARP